MLKNTTKWEWMKKSQQAFDAFKKVVTEELVLTLPNHALLFEVHTDASDFAIGVVLMKTKHPIAFENRKLNNTERRYMVQEKEMTAVVHCLHT